jgi:hypothetical protein
MHATLAFLNGAGSRRNLKSGSTDRRLLMLTNLLFTTGFTPQPGYLQAEPVYLRAALSGRAPARRSQKFPR